jgi:hypothetical protein
MPAAKGSASTLLGPKGETWMRNVVIDSVQKGILKTRLRISVENRMAFYKGLEIEKVTELTRGHH